MVLEKIVPEAWLERKPGFGFLLGVGYSLLGILLAAIIFRRDPAIPSVAFTALFLIPLMHRLFRREEEEKSRDRVFTWRRLYQQDKDIFLTYFFVFLGIFIVYSVAASTLPAFQVNTLFREQLGLRAGAGSASSTGFVVSDSSFTLTSSGTPAQTATTNGRVFYLDIFYKILGNNWWVLLATLIVAFLAGEGGIFFVTWNASVWGTVFGVTAHSAALLQGHSSLYLLAIILLIVFPHVFLEIGAYILAGISAGIFSSALGKETLFGGRMKEVTTYCLGILAISLVFLVAGALVETYVLGNNVTYQAIIASSYFGR